MRKGRCPSRCAAASTNSGLRRIIREAAFTTPKWPSAETFYGEYQTGSGYKQTWTIVDGKDRFNVIVTYFKPKDADRLRAEVSETIFGGAVIGTAEPKGQK